MLAGKRYGPGGVRALGGGDAISTHGEGPTQNLGARARAERTENMWLMVVTLDVSKLSGWLNTDAYCRVERRACDARREAVRPGRREGVGWRRRMRHVHGEGPTQGWEGRARAEHT